MRLSCTRYLANSGSSTNHLRRHTARAAALATFGINLSALQASAWKVCHVPAQCPSSTASVVATKQNLMSSALVLPPERLASFSVE